MTLPIVVPSVYRPRMDPRYAAVSEGRCPTCAEELDRFDGFGMCFKCDEGWSIESGRVFIHTLEMHFEDGEDGTTTWTSRPADDELNDAAERVHHVHA